MEETIRFYSKSFRFGWCQQADVVEHAHDGWLDGLLFSSPASAEEKTASDKGGHIILSLDIMTMTHQVTQIHSCLQTQIYHFSETFIIFPSCLHVVVVVVPMVATTSTIITFLLLSASTGVSQVFVHLQIWGLSEAKARFLINQSSACGIYPSWKPRWLFREWLWGLPGAGCWEIDGCLGGMLQHLNKQTLKK